MKRAPYFIRWVLASLGVMAAPLLGLTATSHSRAAGLETRKDQALERPSAQGMILDDPLKVAIVDVVNRCDGSPR